MSHESHLYATRRAELDELITAHPEAHALDEGNAGAFDALIETWLQEELARIDLAESALVRDEAAAAAEEAKEAKRQAALEARAHHQRVQAQAEAEARHLRDEKRRDDARRSKALITEAKRERRSKLLINAEQRLEAAAAALLRAELLLLGDLPGGAPASSSPARAEDSGAAGRAA